MKKLLLFIALIIITFTINAQSTISIGILSDYNPNDSIGSRINNSITEELRKVMGIDYKLVVNASLIKSCNWNSEIAKQKYAELSKIADDIEETTYFINHARSLHQTSMY